MKSSYCTAICVGILSLLLLVILTNVNTGKVEEEVQEFAPVVQLKGGKVKGTVVHSDDGSKVLAYQGIRYGHAVRFAKPVPVEPWTDVYNATHWRDACPQNGFEVPPYNDSSSQTKSMSEDCLYVNVWRPQKEKANRAVMVYYHGGGFESGSIFSTIYDGRFLASRDVIVVTVAYRLSTFGFSYFGPLNISSESSTEVVANQAFHDQILALHWVRENIAAFGGDKDKITIFGESAGSVSVSAFILSPLTRGLFKRAILQSGVIASKALNNAVNQPLKRTESLAAKLNCSSSLGQSSVVQCLRGKSVEEVLAASKTLTLPLAPTFNDQAVLPFSDGVQALQEGHFNAQIDLLYGVNRDEGSIVVAMIFPELNSPATVLNKEKVRTYIEKLHGSSPYATEIADFYLKNVKSDEANQDKLRTIISDAFGDPNIACPTVLFGEALAKAASRQNKKGGHTYSYRLTQPLRSAFPFAGGCTGWKGVCHIEDVVYLFAVNASQPEDHRLSREMLTAWTNFAKTGSPGKLGGPPNQVEWTEALPSATDVDHYTNHMNLNAKNFQMVPNYFRGVCNAFWKTKIFA